MGGTTAAAVALAAGLAALFALPGHPATALSPTKDAAPATTTTTTTTAPLPPATLPSRRPSEPGRIITPGRSFPDPFILPVAGGYELYASQTGLGGAQIQVAFSRHLGAWSHVGAALAGTPPWATAGFTWAPDVRRIEGRFVMYFDAMANRWLYFDAAAPTNFSRRAQCIGVATSADASGPFRAAPSPLICDFAHHGAIDPRTFVGPDGQVWLDWKSDGNAATPAPFPPTRIYAEALTRNGLALAGPPHLLLAAVAGWESHIVEAPQMVRAGSRYYLFYSGSWFNQPTYGIGVAVCAGPVGPCRNLSARRPFIGSDRQGEGPGEESLFEEGAGRWWIAYSPWYAGYLGRTYRPIALARIHFGRHGPFLQ